MAIQLKKITIYNFKSYHGVTVIEDIEPGHSIFVGENGAGKSSIFQAIEFVLTPERKKSTWKELLNVLSHRTSEGYIELLFSCGDEIFNGNIRIRKSFSFKQCSKESFTINGECRNRQSVMALLEICGLRFYNPFILNANSVSTFTHYSPKEALLFLLKCLGATVYESYIFINELFYTLEELKEKLDQLSILCSQASKVHPQGMKNTKMKLHEMKLSILYNILGKEKAKLFQKKGKLEEHYQMIAPRRQESVDLGTLKKLRKEIIQLQNFVRSQEDIIDDLKKEEEDLLKKHEKIIHSMNFIDNELKFLKGYSDQGKQIERINLLKKEKQSTLQELKIVEMSLKEKRTNSIKLEARLEMIIEQRNDLICKLENPLTYHSATGQLLPDKIREEQKVKEELNILLTKNEELVKKRSNFLEEMDKITLTYLDKTYEINQRIIHLRQELNTFQENLSELRRVEKQEEETIFEISGFIQGEGLKLQKIVGSAIVKGCESVMSVVENWRSSNISLSDDYYGMVVENFKCSNGLNLAVETSIGSRLFSHVVLNNNVGTKILGQMKNYNLPGEAWFIPLNIRSPQRNNYPELKRGEPILKRLEYSPRFEKVMEFLFGSIMVCLDLESASHIAGTYGFTCVTIQGDRVSRKREMYGGYFDTNRSSIRIFNTISELQTQKLTKEEFISNIKKDINAVESNINETMSQIQRLKPLCLKENNLVEVRNLRIQLHNVEQELLAIERSLDRKRCHLYKLNLLTEKSPGETTLPFETETDAMVRKIKILNKEIKDLEESLNDANLTVIHLEQDRIKLREKLNHHYQIITSEDKEQTNIKEFENKLALYNTKLLLLDHRLTHVRKGIEGAEIKIKAGEGDKSKKVIELQEIQDSGVDYLSDNREEISNKISLYNKQIDDKNNFLRILKEKYRIGALKSYQKYRNMNTKMLYNELRKVKEELNRLESERTSHLNGNNYSSDILERFSRLENISYQNYVFFGQFVDWLHSFITNKLEQISSHFTEIFRTITEGGEAYLFADDDGSSDNWPALPNITGINICVCFSNSEQTWNLSNLSNGQKVCVLLALTLACIKTGSVPLFIFDEINKSLNNQQKNILEQLIHAHERTLQTLSSAHSFEEASSEANLFKVDFMTMDRKVIKILKNEED